MGEELCVEEYGIERFKSIGVQTDQLDWFALECLRNRKKISIYTHFGRNSPIVWINGYDETVHRGPFQLYRSRPILMERPDEST